MSLFLSLPKKDSTTAFLYPPPSPSKNLTVSTLDVLNASWISFPPQPPTTLTLTLTCLSSTNNTYTPIISLPNVPVTGNRLIPLSSAADYTTCRLDLSFSTGGGGPSQNTTTQSTTFQILPAPHDPATAPVLWTLTSTTNGNKCSPSSGNHKLVMVGIGLGVAVGVFSLTTAVGWLLFERARRRRGVGREEGGRGKDEWLREWIGRVRESSRGGSGGDGNGGGGGGGGGEGGREEVALEAVGGVERTRVRSAGE
ncbi:MAG: hypothetical protein Q9220_004267 [cf. Caloplaca sp. 1 TL-2023]